MPFSLTRSEAAFIVFWIACGAYWVFRLIWQSEHGEGGGYSAASPVLGLLSSAAGVATQVIIRNKRVRDKGAD